MSNISDAQLKKNKKLLYNSWIKYSKSISDIIDKLEKLLDRYDMETLETNPEYQKLILKLSLLKKIDIKVLQSAFEKTKIELWESNTVKSLDLSNEEENWIISEDDLGD